MLIQPAQFANLTYWSRPAQATARTEEPQDTLSLQRPLWREVDRLGLWTTFGAMNGPLAGVIGQAATEDLKALLQEVESRGYRFTHCWNPNEKYTDKPRPTTVDEVMRQVTQGYSPGDAFRALGVTRAAAKPEEPDPFSLRPRNENEVDHAQIETFQDLKNVETLLVEQERPTERTRRLAALEAAGAEFVLLKEKGREGYSVGEAIKNELYRPVGLYGAERALQAPDSQLWIRPKGFKGLYPLHTEQDLETAEFFLSHKSSPTLDKDPVARRLRDLSSIGITYHNGDDFAKLDAMAAYHALTERRWSQIGMSLDGVAKETVRLEGSKVPEPSHRLLALAEFHSREIAPLEVSHQEKIWYAHGLTWADDKHSLDDCLRLIRELKDFELSLHGPPEDPAQLTLMGVRSLANLMRARGKDQTVADVRPEYAELKQRGVKGDVASNAIAHFRDKLRPQTFDEQEFQQERERLLELSEFAGSFDQAAEARKVVRIDTPEPYADRLQAVKLLTEMERRHTRDGWDSKTNPVNEALRDYRTILASPRQSLAQAAELLSKLHDAMVPRVGHEGSREMYDYLQRGIQKGVFGSEAVEVFAREFDLAKHTDFARAFLREPAPVPEPYAERAEAAAFLRESYADLKPRKSDEVEEDEIGIKTRKDVDEAAVDYRFLLGLPNRSLVQDAKDLSALHHMVGDWIRARGIFSLHKYGELGDPTTFIARFEAELKASGDVDLARRATAGEYPLSLEERQQLLPDAADYRTVLQQHKEGLSLREQAEVLGMLHRALDPQEGADKSREAYGRLMTSLRGGPWSELPLQDAVAEFLKVYTLRGDLTQALGAVEIPPDNKVGPGGIQSGDGHVSIGGVRIRTRKR